MQIVPAFILKNARSGFSLPLGLIIGGLLLLAISSLSFYSQHEMRWLRATIAQKKTEYAAYAGLQWVYGKLREKTRGRWYQPPGSIMDGKGKIQRPNAWSQTIEIFPDEPSMKVTIFLDEVESASEIEVPNGKLKLLDYIHVLALAEQGQESSLLYGKFIAAPEPILNSDETDGVVSAPVSSYIEVDLTIPGDLLGKFSLEDEAKITAILGVPGQIVKKGEPLASFKISSSVGGNSLDGLIKTPYGGSIKKIYKLQGKKAKIGDVIIRIRRDKFPLYSPYTLKKLFKVTPIPESFYRSLNLSKMGDRYAVYQVLLEKLSDFGRNFSETYFAENKFENLFQPTSPPALEQAEVLSNSATALENNSNDELENLFLVHLLPTFCPPLGLSEKNRLEFSKSDKFSLEIQASELNADVLELLEILGAIHDRDFMAEAAPPLRQKVNLYQINSLKKYLDQLDPTGTKREGKKQSVSEFLSTFGGVANGAKCVLVSLDEASSLDRQPFLNKMTAGELNPEEFFYFSSMDKYYRVPPIPSIQIFPISNNYWCENTVCASFSIRMDYLFKFFRKHYTEDIPRNPGSENRLESDSIDFSNVPIIPGPLNIGISSGSFRIIQGISG